MKPYKRKLTAEQVAEIRRRHGLRRVGCPKTMSKEYGVHVSIIRKIIYGAGLSTEQVEEILKRWKVRQQGSPKVLAREFGVTATTIQRIVNGETWNESSD